MCVCVCVLCVCAVPYDGGGGGRAVRLRRGGGGCSPLLAHRKYVLLTVTVLQSARNEVDVIW